MADADPAFKWEQLRRAWEALLARARAVQADTRNHRHVAVLRRTLHRKRAGGAKGFGG